MRLLVTGGKVHRHNFVHSAVREHPDDAVHRTRRPDYAGKSSRWPTVDAVRLVGAISPTPRAGFAAGGRKSICRWCILPPESHVDNAL